MALSLEEVLAASPFAAGILIALGSDILSAQIRNAVLLRLRESAGVKAVLNAEDRMPCVPPEVQLPNVGDYVEFATEASQVASGLGLTGIGILTAAGASHLSGGYVALVGAILLLVVVFATSWVSSRDLHKYLRTRLLGIRVVPLATVILDLVGILIVVATV